MYFLSGMVPLIFNKNQFSDLRTTPQRVTLFWCETFDRFHVNYILLEVRSGVAEFTA